MNQSLAVPANDQTVRQLQLHGQFFGVFVVATAANQEKLVQFVLNIDENCCGRGLLLVPQPLEGAPYALTVRLQLAGNELTASVEGLLHRDALGIPYLAALPNTDGQPLNGGFRGHFNALNREFRGKWWLSDGRGGLATFGPMPRSAELLVAPCATWDNFKTWASLARDSDNPITAFRGHGDNTWRLESTLHRVGRNDLWQYNARGLNDLQEDLSSIGILLNRSDPGDFSRLLAIAQHHGFPTPLLDWTRSPYIAAYFAFADALEKQRTSTVTHVRIFGLTERFAKTHSPALVHLTEIAPTVAFLKISARDNPRLLAQQGLFTMSTVRDVQHYLTSQTVTPQNDFLRAIDIPVTEAGRAISDLAYMGITAATLFPGLDGICRKLKYEMIMGRL